MGSASQLSPAVGEDVDAECGIRAVGDVGVGASLLPPLPLMSRSSESFEFAQNTSTPTCIVHAFIESGEMLGPVERKERFRDRWLAPYVVLQVASTLQEVSREPRGKTSQIGVRSSHRKSTINPVSRIGLVEV